MTGDVAVLLIVGIVFNGIRDGAVLGAAAADLVGRWLPVGYLGEWHFALALLIGLLMSDAYGRGDTRHHGVRLFTGVAIGTGLAIWQTVWTGGALPAASQFIVTLAGVGGALAVGRMASSAAVSRIVPVELRAERVLFVGHPKDEATMRTHARLVGRAGMIPVGWVSDVDGPFGDPYLGHIDAVWDILQEETIDTVLLSDSMSAERFSAVFEACSAAGCRVLAISQFGGHAVARPGFVWHRGVPFVQLTVPSLKAWRLMLKRTMDVVGASVGLMVLAPFLALVALAIRVHSPGPVFFSHQRVGLGGRVFKLLKFRTMRVGADRQKHELAHLNCSGDPRLFKVRNDPRVTRLGCLLRRWSIDELPQLWNVLKGEMSLVGPRPFFEADLSGYSDHHFARLCAKPGITGLWQVKGRSDVVDFEEVVRLDRQYIDHWSLWLDCRILCLTVPVVLGREGAF